MEVVIEYNFRDEHGNEYPISSTKFKDAKSYLGINTDGFVGIVDADHDTHRIHTKHIRIISVIDND